MGVAVLEGKELIYHGVQTMPGGGSPQHKLRRAVTVVSRLMRDYRPQTLAIERAFFFKSRNAALLNVFVDEVNARARRAGVAVMLFAPSTVKKAITGNGRATKKQVAAVVVSLYPELKAYLHHDPKWKQRFHHNMFDAVAVGLTALGSVSRSR